MSLGGWVNGWRYVYRHKMTMKGSFSLFWEGNMKMGNIRGIDLLDFKAIYSDVLRLRLCFLHIYLVISIQLKLPASSTFYPSSLYLPHPSLSFPPFLPPSFDLLPALLCWSSNHNPGPWQMEDRREKLLTSQPEPLLCAHQLLPASPPCIGKKLQQPTVTITHTHTHSSDSCGDALSSRGMVRVLVQIWPH